MKAYSIQRKQRGFFDPGLGLALFMLFSGISALIANNRAEPVQQSNLCHQFEQATPSSIEVCRAKKT